MKSFGRLVSCLLWKQAPCKNQSHASGSSSSSGSSSGGRSVAGSGGVSAATGSSSVVTSSAAAVAASSPPSPTYVSTRTRNCASDEAVKQTLVVELNQSEGEELGLVVTGGIDKDSPPRVAYMKPNGVAYRSDLLEVGDLLMSVNGVDVTLMKHFEIVNMLQNSSNQRTLLELHYTLPDPHQLSFSVVCRRIEVRLSREAEGEAFGLTLRGGANGSDPRKSRPLIVTQIRPGSPADREGTLKVGDRVLAVNRVNVAQRSLPEVLRLLRELKEAVFLVEYDVSVLEVVQNATGPLLVEIDKLPGYSLGVTLTRALYHGKPVFVVDRIAPASIADRCGALHVGDHLLSIDGVGLDDVTVAAANGMLNANTGTQLQLEVVPGSLVRAGTVGPAAPDSLKCTTVHGNPSAGGDRMFPSASLNSVSSVQSRATINSMKTQVGSALSSSFFFGASRDKTPHHGGGGGGGGGWDSSLTRGQTASAGNTLLSSSSGLSQVCHVDTTEVMLVYDQRGSFGLVVDAVPGRPIASNGMLMEPPIIRHVEHKGPAERCGVLQEGDRVLAINGQYLEGRTMVEVNEMMKESGVKMLLLVEFNVAESIIPSSGVFVVKLAKRNAGLGITISCPRNRRPGQHLVISNVKKGSVAHRTGSIQPGDKLLAINNVRLDNCTLEDSARVLQDTQDIVKLTIKKDENFADEPDPTHLITYTVELPKFAGPIGITISGSEEPFDPIFISSLTEEGLAEKTGALHVGDRLLAINGVSLRGRTLSDAIQLLQNAGQTVTLKITRPTNRGRRTSSEPSGKHGSMDSALESWDSSGLEAIHKSFSLKEPQTSKGGSSENSDRKVNNRIGEESGETAMKSKKVDPREEEETGGGVGWDFVTVTSPSASVPPSCCSSGGGDEWSRQVDDLDHLNAAATAGAPGLDSFSDLPDITEADAAFDCHRHSAAIDAGYFTVDEADSKRLYPPSKAEEEDDGPDTVAAPGGGGGLPGVDAAAADDSSVFVAAADVHLKEVEEQLQNIFTPTPIELTKVTLWKRSDSDDFGFSLSDGVFEKGVYVGAVRPRGPAAEALRPYDRLLQVNSVRTKDLDCCQVVPVIARSGNRVDLVISRNPLLTRSPSEEEEGVDDTASAPATLPRREDPGWGGGGGAGAGAGAGARQGSASSSSAAAAAWQTRRTTTVPRNSKPRRVAFRMDPSSTA